MKQQLTNFFRRGFLYSLACVFNRIVPERLFRLRYFVIMRLSSDPTVSPFQPDVRCVWCESDDKLSDAETLSRFQRSDFDCPVNATLAFLQNHPVASFWVAEDRFDEYELGVRILLDKNQRWLFGAMVEKQHRGKRIFPELLRFTSSGLTEAGVEQQFAAVNPVNNASMAVFKNHASIVGRVFAIRLFRIAFCVLSGNGKADRLVSLDCTKRPIQISQLV